MTMTELFALIANAISLYSESYSWFQAKIILWFQAKSKSHNKNDTSFFLVAGLQQLMVTHVSKTLNA